MVQNGSNLENVGPNSSESVKTLSNKYTTTQELTVLTVLTVVTVVTVGTVVTVVMVCI